jgi:hypothetical protein
MSVKSIGYKPAMVPSGTYTTPKITVNTSGQIVDIISQVIDPDDSQQEAYETLAGTMEDVQTALDTVTSSFASLTQIQGIENNLSLYAQTQALYSKVFSDFQTLVPAATFNVVNYTLAQTDFSDRVVGDDRALNPTSFFLDAGYYNIDFSFIAATTTPANKESDFYLRVSYADDTLKGPCKVSQYGTWDYNGSTYIAFNGSTAFEINSYQQVDILVPNTFNGATIFYTFSQDWPIGVYVDFPVSGDYSGLPSPVVPPSPAAIVITALNYNF